MRNTRLAGHWLRSKGAGYKWEGNPPRLVLGSRTGIGWCSCGATSGLLASDAARQRWHRDVHKAAIRKAVAVADPDAVTVTFEVTITMTAEQRALYGAGLGVGFVAQDVLGRVRPEVLDAIKALPWVSQYASVSISRPEAVAVTEEASRD